MTCETKAKFKNRQKVIRLYLISTALKIVFSKSTPPQIY